VSNFISGMVLDWISLTFSGSFYASYYHMHNYRFQQSTLRENSMELESAKKLVSEKEVVIKNLEDKLSVCQSELDSKEKKLNDVEVRIIQNFNTNISTMSL